MVNKYHRVKYFFTILIIFYYSISNTYAESNYVNIEISSEQSSINLGEPVVIKVVYRFEEAHIYPKTETIYQQISHSASLEINKDGITIIKNSQVDPFDMFLRDNEGFEYMGVFVLWYDYTNKKLFFEEPGEYVIRVSDYGKYTSNPLTINVKSGSNREQKAISLLTDPIDYAALLYSDIDEMTDERIGCFQKVVDECDGTLIAKMAAARLGIEKVEELENKYNDGIKFMEQYRKGEIDESLVESANTHLTMAYKLPDGFPIREAVLNKLAVIELFNGKYKKVNSLFDELAAKYPHGEHGKRATRDKEEFKVLMERYPMVVAEVKEKPLGVILPIAAAAIAGVVIAGFVLLSRKKQKPIDKSAS